MKFNNPECQKKYDGLIEETTQELFKEEISVDELITNLVSKVLFLIKEDYIYIIINGE